MRVFPSQGDHPLRYATVNELHARPFPSLEVPSTAVYVAIKEPVRGAEPRPGARCCAHLLALLDRHGSAHPQPGATHFQGPIGRAELKWESHTEFVTYSAFTKGLSARPFDPAEAEVLPEDWLNAGAGQAADLGPDPGRADAGQDAEAAARLDAWFVPESLAMCPGGGRGGRGGGGFPHRPGGAHALCGLRPPGTGPRRVGRIVQRLCEIETYRAMSMLGLMRSRDLSARLNALDPKLSALVSGLDDGPAPEAALHDLAGDLGRAGKPGGAVFVPLRGDGGL
jgi:hypothetical protein